MTMLFFITMRWLDVADILLVSVIMYQLYRLVKGTIAINIFAGITTIYLLWLVVKALNMQLLGSILGQFIGVGVIALIIVFQQELRRFLLLLGTTGFFSGRTLPEWLKRWRTRKNTGLDITSIIKACKNMSETKTGAIIVITTKSDLKFYANTGDIIQAKLSQRLIESIFFKNNPLHDGAIIIQDNRIKAARCVLPVTENADFPAHLGMRHRAAVGVTEISDAIAITVSEQTGEMSLARHGHLKTGLAPEQLRMELEKELEKG